MVDIRAVFLAVILLTAPASYAYAFCFEEAGAQYGINPQILRAIAKVESNNNPAAINMNTNGTYDFGLMQINSLWAATIGKERWNSLGDACSNAKTGAWILSMCMNKYGYTWKGIGCYNSQTPGKRDRYSKLVFDQLQRVKPLAQEAAYTPLKERVEELVRQKVEGWVDNAAQGKASEFTEAIPAAAKTAQEPPSLNGSTFQSALSGGFMPQNSLTSWPAENGLDTGEQAGLDSSPGVMP